MIAAAVLLALAGPAAAVCKGTPRATAAYYFADEQLHRTLRAEVGVPMPIVPEQITIYAEGGMVGVTESASIVATRGGDGGWRTDTVTRTRILGGEQPPGNLAPVTSRLPAALGQRLDALLARRDFWQAPRRRRGLAVPPLHPTMLTIDVATPICSHRAVVVRSVLMGEEQPPLLAEIVRIVTADHLRW